MKKVVFILIFLLAGNVYAQSATQMLQQKLSGFQSMTADFSQTVTTEENTILQKTSGNMALKRPGKFRWETTTGIKQLIVTDGVKLWIYDPELKQVTIRRLGSSIGQTPILLLTHSHFDLQKHFVISKISRDQPGDWFQLIPKSKDGSFASVMIGFDNNKIIGISFTNQLKQKTDVWFSNVKINPANLPDFSFVVPAGTDVVDEYHRS
ncbi:MAG: outer membrane lipoprotein chaperone LolA [Gammaproteobacteria bacterium]|jgi:outer membrane lipoprotein carrier protein